MALMHQKCTTPLFLFLFFWRIIKEHNFTYVQIDENERGVTFFPLSRVFSGPM
jgi:hypothetical protein